MNLEPYSKDQIRLIKKVTLDSIDFVLSELNIDIENGNGLDEIRTSCPIHGGDNKTAFSINTKFGSWKCYTANCHKDGNTIFDLIKLVTKKNFAESLAWLCDILKINIKSGIKLSNDDMIIDKLISQHNIRQFAIKQINLVQKPERFEQFDFNLIKNKVEPSEYFLNKGFKYETLKHFHVGFCKDPYKPMYLRSYCPILNDDGTTVVGVTGRIKYEKCEYCPDFHEQGNGCPRDNAAVRGFPKWKHFGFNKSLWLYNFYNAKQSIQDTSCVILTEGTKEIWALHEMDVKNAACVFGTELSINHVKKITKCNANTIVLLLDNDEKGQEAAEKIYNNYKNYFNILNISSYLKDNKDLDEQDAESKQNIKNIITEICR